MKTQEYSIIGVLSSSKPNLLKYLLAKLSKNLNFSATSPKMSFVPVTVGINIKIVNLLFCEGIHKFLIRKLFNKTRRKVGKKEIEWIVATVTIVAGIVTIVSLALETYKATNEILKSIREDQK